MTTKDWIKSNVEYGRSLVDSGLEGARSATNSALEGVSVGEFLIRSVRESWLPTLVGAYVGALGASIGNRRKTNYGAVGVAGVVGAAIGLTTGMAWGTRRLTGDMARGAIKNIDKTRDAHWLEKNPVPYG